MLISGDDVIRNIPEQVAKNTEDIDELNHRMPVPEYFYTKDETDALLAQKANSSSVYTKAENDALLAQKANSSDVYTKGEIDTALANRKLYYHPINFFRRQELDGINITVEMVIINDSSEPLDTVAKILAEVRSWGLAEASIGCNGSVYNNSDVYIITDWSITQLTSSVTGMKVTDGEVIGLSGFEVLVDPDTITIKDAVNKIL